MGRHAKTQAPIGCRKAILQSARRWQKIARIRERAGEIDESYLDRSTGETLLVRHSPSITERRLRQAHLILEQGDFDWIALVPAKHRSIEPLGEPRLGIFAAGDFQALASKAGLA